MDATDSRDDTRSLSGHIAFVTGGSRGLGRAICVELARCGADVAFNYLKSEDQARETLALIEAHGVLGFRFATSVLDAEGLQALVSRVEEEAGTIDILVNNAGVGQVVPLALMEEEDWDMVMDTTVKGAFLATRAVLRGMVRKKYGRILNVSSLAGVKTMQAPVHYSTAKAALTGFTGSLAKEVGRYGITVNCIAPGILDEGVSRNLPPRRLEQYVDHCALGRVGTLEEVARVASFLVSEENSYISGETIVVDGAV